MEGATMVSTISRGHLVLLVAGLGGLIATSFASINAQEAEKPPLSSTRSVPTFPRGSDWRNQPRKEI